MTHYKVQSLSEADITRLELASDKGASAAKEIRGLRKDIAEAGDHGIAELTDLHTEMDNALMSIFNQLAGKSGKSTDEVGKKKTQKKDEWKYTLLREMGNDLDFTLFTEKIENGIGVQYILLLDTLEEAEEERLDDTDPEDVIVVRALLKDGTVTAYDENARVLTSGTLRDPYDNTPEAKMKAQDEENDMVFYSKEGVEFDDPHGHDYNYFYATADPTDFDNQWKIDLAFSTKKEAMDVAKTSGQSVHLVAVEDDVWDETIEDNDGLTGEQLHDEINDWTFAEAGSFQILDTLYNPDVKAKRAKKSGSKKPAASKPNPKKNQGPLRGAAKMKNENKAARATLLHKTENRSDLRSLSEKEVLAIARQFTDLRVNVKRDENTASKQRVSPTPENLIRWMRNPGGFDLVGIDSAKATTPTADLKMDTSSWFQRFVAGHKD